MRVASTGAFLLLLCLGPVRAQDKPEPTKEEQELESLSEYYYLHKNTNDVSRILRGLQANKVLDENEGAVDGIAAFLTVVFTESPEKIDSILKSKKFTGKTREAIQRGLWMSGHTDKIEEHFGKLPKFAKEKATDLKERPVKEPGDLDMMWGAFTASGDTVYARRVMETMDEDHELTGDDRKDTATRGAAEWSLGSFVRNHELVYRMVQSALKSQPDPVKKKLRKILDQIKIPKLEKNDGEFTASLYIMDDAMLEEFKKPSDQALHITEKGSAHVGDIVGIKIMFAGIKLADDLKALVDYDLKVLDPDGGFYDDTDLKGLEALHGKVGHRFTFFDNTQVTMLRFEAKDKPGTYIVQVTVRDKIGKKSVSLEKKITLSK